MEIIENENDRDTGKLRGSPDVLERLGISLEQHAVVTFSRGTRVLCRVCGWSDCHTNALSVDRMKCLTADDPSDTTVATVEAIAEPAKAVRVEVSLEPLTRAPPPYFAKLGPLVRLALLNHVVGVQRVTLHQLDVASGRPVPHPQRRRRARRPRHQRVRPDHPRDGGRCCRVEVHRRGAVWLRGVS